MRFRRLVFLIITVLATFGSLMANPAGAIEPWDVTDESECLANGFVWYEGYCDYPDWDPEPEEPYDDGSLWSATNEEDCLARGGAWFQDGDWGYCYEDDGSAWSARDEGTCLTRGGIWEQEQDWGHCYEAVSYTNQTLPTNREV